MDWNYRYTKSAGDGGGVVVSPPACIWVDKIDYNECGWISRHIQQPFQRLQCVDRKYLSLGRNENDIGMSGRFSGSAIHLAGCIDENPIHA